MGEIADMLYDQMMDDQFDDDMWGDEDGDWFLPRSHQVPKATRGDFEVQPQEKKQ